MEINNIQENILYYSHEYYCNYGARTHAREFFKSLKETYNKGNVYIFPEYHDANNASAKSFTKMILSFLPKNLILILNTILINQTEFKKLKKSIKDNNIKIIIIRAGYKLELIRQIKKLKEIKQLVIEVNASITDESLKKCLLKKLLEKREILIYNKADLVTVVSESLKKELEKRGLNDQNILVNPNGVNVDFYKPNVTEIIKIRKDLNLNEASTILGYIGGFEKFKQIPRVINEFYKIASYKHLTLIIIGHGDDINEIKSIIKELPEKSNRKVILLNTWIPYEYLPNYIAIFDICIFPYTVNYVSPLKIYEYLSSGKPTIAPKISALVNSFVNGENIFFVDQDTGDFTNVVSKILDDMALSQIVGKRGQETVYEHYTWAKNAERILENIK